MSEEKTVYVQPPKTNIHYQWPRLQEHRLKGERCEPDPYWRAPPSVKDQAAFWRAVQEGANALRRDPSGQANEALELRRLRTWSKTKRGLLGLTVRSYVLAEVAAAIFAVFPSAAEAATDPWCLYDEELLRELSFELMSLGKSKFEALKKNPAKLRARVYERERWLLTPFTQMANGYISRYGYHPVDHAFPLDNINDYDGRFGYVDEGPKRIASLERGLRCSTFQPLWRDMRYLIRRLRALQALKLLPQDLTRRDKACVTKLSRQGLKLARREARALDRALRGKDHDPDPDIWTLHNFLDREWMLEAMTD